MDVKFTPVPKCEGPGAPLELGLTAVLKREGPGAPLKLCGGEEREVS